jgi:hypothetical protein
MLNLNLSQKVNLIGGSKFNYLINTSILPFTCGLKLHFNSNAQKVKHLIEVRVNDRVKV